MLALKRDLFILEISDERILNDDALIMLLRIMMFIMITMIIIINR